jgi:hypothetical protein
VPGVDFEALFRGKKPAADRTAGAAEVVDVVRSHRVSEAVCDADADRVAAGDPGMFS